LGQPVAVISNNSSKVTRDILRASGTTRGSVVNTPDTSVYSSHASAARTWARATAVVSEPPRPRNVTSLSTDTPCEPATTGTRPAATAARTRSGRISRMRAFWWMPSVTKPAWLPVNESAGTPRSASAMQTSAQALRSPVVINMSISRPGLVLETAFARRRSSSVSLPIADTTKTIWSPRLRAAAT
jgi:hypothetical protein